MLSLIWNVKPVVASNMQAPSAIAFDAGFKIDIGCLNYRTIIQKVDSKSPAAAAGLKPGDEIVSIDEIPTIGLRPDKILALLKSSNQLLHLRVLRDDQLLSFSMSKDFPIPAWNEVSLKAQLKKAREENTTEHLLASLINLARYYDALSAKKEAEPYVDEIEPLVNKEFRKNDRRLVVVFCCLIKHCILDTDGDRFRASFEKYGDELLELTKNPKRFPKIYGGYFYQLAERIPDGGNSAQFYDIKEVYLRRAAAIAKQGTEEPLTHFEELIGPRENIEFGFGTPSDLFGHECLTQYGLRNILDSLAHVLFWEGKKKEAMEVGRESYDICKMLRSRFVPNTFMRPDLLIEFYRKLDMNSDAMSLMQNETDYLQSVYKRSSDDFTRFQSSLDLSQYLLFTGILRERMHDYEKALASYDGSLQVLTASADIKDPTVRKCYPDGGARDRRFVLSSKARCEAALGRYQLAKQHFLESADPHKGTAVGMAQLLDGALVDLLTDNKSSARLLCQKVSAMLQLFPNRLVDSSKIKYAIRDVKLLSKLDEKEEAGRLNESIISAFKQRKPYLESQRTELGTADLTSYLNEGGNTLNESGQSIVKDVTDGKPMTECFLSLDECDRFK